MTMREKLELLERRRAEAEQGGGASRLAAQHELVDFVSREPSLEEVFLSEYASRRGEAPAGVGS